MMLISCSIPPTRMMPLMALVTLISGVCSAGLTFQTTWKPTKIARMNTVKCDSVDVSRRDRAEAEKSEGGDEQDDRVDARCLRRGRGLAGLGDRYACR